METTARQPSEAISFLDHLETGITVGDSKLVCYFSRIKEKDFPNAYKLFTEKLSLSKTLKHLVLSRILISEALGDALVENCSIQTIEVKNCHVPGIVTSEDETKRKVYFLKCLERSINITAISLEERMLNEEETDLVLNSHVLRNRLVSLDSIVLKNKQIHTPFCRFSRLTVLKVLQVPTPNIFLRNLCFCENLEKLDFVHLLLKDIFRAFPKWNGELRNLFPLAGRLSLESPFTSLLKDILSSNVAVFLSHNNLDEFSKTDVRSLLSSAARGERKTSLTTYVRPRRGSFNSNAILFTARLRSKDANWEEGVFGSSDIWI